MLKKGIYLAGIRIRNNMIFDRYVFLKQSEKWDLKKLQDYQYQRLKELLHHAYNHSEYYRDKFDGSDIRPDEISLLEDIKRIPPTTKEELLNNVRKIQVKHCHEKLFFSETSGSSGAPLVFYRNKDWDAWHRAAVYRGYSWYELKPWERNGYLWGYNIAQKRRIKIKILDALQNRFRLFSYKDEEVDEFARKLKKAAFLSGYSSMIYEIARRINKSKINSKLDLKMVIGTSEKIFDKYQSEIQKAFGKKMISEYGAAEAGIIAFECPQGNMHITMETVIVEEEGHEIVVTNLVSKSFPIIRYKLGDYVELDRETKCACGMEHHIIKEVTGRVGKVIHGLKNQYPSLTLYYVFKNLAMEYNLILNYQVTQSAKGSLRVDIENEIKTGERTLLLQEFNKYFNNDMNLEINDKAYLKTLNKKKIDFVSEL